MRCSVGWNSERKCKKGETTDGLLNLWRRSRSFVRKTRVFDCVQGGMRKLTRKDVCLDEPRHFVDTENRHSQRRVLRSANAYRCI